MKKLIKIWIICQVVCILVGGIFIIIFKTENNRYLNFDKVEGNILDTWVKDKFAKYDDTDKVFYGLVEYYYKIDRYQQEVGEIHKDDKKVLLYVNPNDPNEVICDSQIEKNNRKIIFSICAMFIIPILITIVQYLINYIKIGRRKEKNA